MKRLIVTLFALAALFAGTSARAEESTALSIEQQLVNDLAGRLSQQLHKTAALADKLRQATDPKERADAFKDYQKAMASAMHIEHLIAEMSGDPNARGGKMGMMGGGKGAGGGMSCMCMKGKKGGMKGMMSKKGGKSKAAKDNEDDEEAEKEGEGDEAGDSGEDHEGHH